MPVVWNKQRLVDFARARLDGAKLIVVSNHEPYFRIDHAGECEYVQSDRGLIAAADPVLQACGGVWVSVRPTNDGVQACATRERIGLPPNDPRYILRSVRLDQDLETAYQAGFANGMLWPLCHQVFARPVFHPAHWEAYLEVNERVAQAVLEEARGGPALVFVQDYHFAILPRLLKKTRPDLVVAQFWHIPWPNVERFHVCPWARQLLDGLLGNDLLGFHTQGDCNNFLECADSSLECRIDRERFAVCRGGRQTSVRPYPVSVDPGLADEHIGSDWRRIATEIRARHGLEHKVLLGVDRIDYTKGIPERLRAVERLILAHPELKEQFHFVQVAAPSGPSRMQQPAYRELSNEIEELAQRINLEHGSPTWKPVVFINEHMSTKFIYVLYRMARGCVVSSLQDGMNLVSKEFVTARGDERGVLVLSRFTGAARELPDAVQVNPFDLEELAGGLYTALTMPPEEQEQRMRRMRAHVCEHNIYRWVARQLDAVRKLLPVVSVSSRERRRPNESARPGPKDATGSKSHRLCPATPLE
jgi:trehalose 6-phosphate synthase